MALALSRAPFGFLILASLALSPHLKAEPCTFPSQNAACFPSREGIEAIHNSRSRGADLFIWEHAC